MIIKVNVIKVIKNYRCNCNYNVIFSELTCSKPSVDTGKFTFASICSSSLCPNRAVQYWSQNWEKFGFIGSELVVGLDPMINTFLMKGCASVNNKLARRTFVIENFPSDKNKHKQIQLTR